MKNNRGFSLIEMMIVAAITAILICGAYANMNLLALADTKSCAKTIDVSLDKLRMDTMTKWSKRQYLIIEWRDEEKKYYLNFVTSTSPLDESNWSTAAETIRSKMIAGKSITIKATRQTDGSNQETLDVANPCLILELSSESGAFLSEWRQISIASRTGTSIIHLVTKTGKHYIEEV